MESHDDRPPHGKSSIIEQTMTELVVILLFVTYVVIILMPTVSQNTNLAENLVDDGEAAIDDYEGDEKFLLWAKRKFDPFDIESCWTGHVAPSRWPGERPIPLSIFVDKSDDLRDISEEDRQCIAKICRAVIDYGYERRSRVHSLHIVAYATPEWDGRYTNACDSSRSCNLMLSQERARNVFFSCVDTIEEESIAKWYLATALPIGRGALDNEDSAIRPQTHKRVTRF